MKEGRCKNNHCSTMSNSARCDLNSKDDILELHDKCLNPHCPKIITFTPHQYMFEGGSIKIKLQKFFRGTPTAWNTFFKTAVNVAASISIGMAVIAKTKNPWVGQATTNILKSISGGKILSLTDLYGNGLGLKVM